MPLGGSLSGRALSAPSNLPNSPRPRHPLLITGKEIQIKMLLDAMQNSFNFVPARNAHYAERRAKNGVENRREMCVCVRQKAANKDI